MEEITIDVTVETDVSVDVSVETDVSIDVTVEKGPPGENAGGDMDKATYDQNGNGVVDNAEKLGGNLPSHYATNQDLNAHLADQANPHQVSLELARQVDNTLQGDISTGGHRIRNLPSALNPDEPVTKGDHDAALNGVGRNRGSIDCSLDPNYPASSVGDRWEVSVAGRIGGAAGIIVQVWDEIVCKVDSPGGDQAAEGAKFYVIQGNVNKADENTLGMVQRADEATVNAEVDQEKYVSPFRLGQWLTNILSRALTVAGKWTFGKRTTHTTSTYMAGSGSVTMDLDYSSHVINQNGALTLNFTNAPGAGVTHGQIWLYENGAAVTLTAGKFRGELATNGSAGTLTIISYSYSATDGKMFIVCNPSTEAN